MSTFTDKILKRQLPTDSDWEAHLLEVHAQEPRMTPEAFAEFRDSQGRNSYEILAERGEFTPQATQVLDLACGDGHLIPYLFKKLPRLEQAVGVDMSQECIGAAKESLSDSRVDLQVARAQSLPLADQSIDHVFCHLALMLMTPLDPVLIELQRVLKPEGFLSALIPGGEPVGLHKEVSRLTSMFVQTYLPRAREARAAQPSLVRLAEAGEFVQLQQRMPPENLWNYLRGMYLIAMLPAIAQRELQDEVLTLARDHVAGDGMICLQVPMRCLSVRRDQLVISGAERF